jgi:hypothetical protein
VTGTGHPGTRLSIALLHHPVYDKNRQTVATAITNLDLHDIARAARTYGLFRYFVVTPVPDQRALAERIGRHWREGWGAAYNPQRKEALELMGVVATLDEVRAELAEYYGRPVKTVVTGARSRPESISCHALADRLREDDQPYLLMFGTGWGMTDEIFATADLVLQPIMGPGEYNHLSVRSAAAIILDRLLGER